MNFKKLIIFIIVFTALSYFYFHHIIADRAEVKMQHIKDVKLLPLEDNEQVNYLSVESRDTSYLLERMDDGLWIMREPLIDKADEFNIQGITSTLLVDRKVREFVDEGFDATAVGLNPPEMRIGIGYGDQKRFLLIGIGTHIGANYYARWEDDEKVFLISENFRNVFRKPFTSLRSRKVLTFDEGAVNSLDIQLNDKKFMIKKIAYNDELQWWLMFPYENMAYSDKIAHYIHTLSSIMISDYHDNKIYTDEGLGLSSQESFIKIGDGASEYTLYIGNAHDEGKKYYAYTPDREYVFSVSKDIVDTLTTDVDSFVDSRIHHFDISSIDKVIYKKDLRTVIFVKSENNWNQMVPIPTEDEDMPDVNDYIDNSMMFFTTLEYAEILNAEAIKDYELEETQKMFSMAFYNAHQSLMFNFYAKEEMIIVKEESDPNYFTIPQEKYDEINDLLKSFL